MRNDASIGVGAGGFIFPTLKPGEIVQCLNDLGIPFTDDDLVKPSPHRMQVVYEAFMDILMGVTREQFENPRQQLLDMLDYSEIHMDALSLMGFHHHICRLMVQVGIDDFSVRDIVKPESGRVRRILSAIINFAKFREERMAVFEQYSAKTDEYNDRRQVLENQHNELNDRFEMLKEQREEESGLIQSAQDANNALTTDLRMLKKQQTGLSNDIEVLKREKTELTEKLTNNQFLFTNTAQDCNKIRARIVHSPEKLKQVIFEMGASLRNEKASVATLEKKARGLQIKLDTLVKAEHDLSVCIKLMDECEAEVRKEEEAQKRVSIFKEDIDRKSEEMRDLKLREQQIKRQISTTVGKIERVHQQAEKKRQDAQNKMNELKEIYATMKAERSSRLDNIEKKKSQIEKTEYKVAKLRQSVEQELSGIQIEWAKLRSHVELFMNDVAQGLNLEILL